MAATKSPAQVTTSTVDTVQKLLPDIAFEAGSSFYWSPKNKVITYNPQELDQEGGKWALLHEAAHAKLEHTSYSTDVELLLLEVAAWETAKDLGSTMAIKIDDDHIQDCLDTYRDWLHQRSTCPTCGVVCLQDTPRSYRCHNCNSSWAVSASRFCRPYRLSKHSSRIEKSPETLPRATFQ